MCAVGQELCARPTFLHEAAATGEGGAGGGGGAGAGSGSEEPGDELADLPYDTDEELATRYAPTTTHARAQSRRFGARDALGP